MKNYVAEIQDVRGNGVLNPGPNPGDVSPRSIDWINKIVVHHEAQERPHDYDSVLRYQSEAQYQNTHSIPNSRGIQYHYHIDNTGVIFWMRSLETMLWHCGDYNVNQHSIAICVDGNLQDQQPTLEQAEALKQLLDWLSTQHPEFPAVQSDVYPHQQFFNTACCGANLIPWVGGYRDSGGNNGLAANSGYDWPSLQPQPAPQPAPAPQPQPEPAPAAPIPVPEPQPVSPVNPAPPVSTPPNDISPSVQPTTNLGSTLLAFLRRLWKWLNS